MIRIILSLVTAAFAFVAASCCCTSDSEAPPLRPLPQFQEMPAADSYTVEATK
jgi:hypothetical protein